MDLTKEKLTISFHLDGQVTTMLTYDEITDLITVSERTEEENITVPELKAWIQEASVWRNEIWPMVKKPALSNSDYLSRIKKNTSNNTVELKVQVDGINFGTKWKKSSGTMKLKLRPEAEIVPWELDFMVRCYGEFLKVIETYD